MTALSADWILSLTTHGDTQTSLPLGQAYSNAYPEGTDYRDEGCDLHPACLTCPFERCKYDIPSSERSDVTFNERLEQVRALHGRGLTVKAIAKHLGMSRRTVFRYLARGREKTAPATQLRLVLLLELKLGEAKPLKDTTRLRLPREASLALLPYCAKKGA